MTPEEMGAELGPGWDPWDGGTGFQRGEVVVYWWQDTWNVLLGEWWEPGWSRPCNPDQAVTVAHLLAAVERIADGAEVAPPVLPGATHEVSVLPALHMVRVWGYGDVFPDEARRHGLDLLRAAAEAEA